MCTTRLENPRRAFWYERAFVSITKRQSLPFRKFDNTNISMPYAVYTTADLRESQPRKAFVFRHDRARSNTYNNNSNHQVTSYENNYCRQTLRVSLRVDACSLAVGVLKIRNSVVRNVDLFGTDALLLLRRRSHVRYRFEDGSTFLVPKRQSCRFFFFTPDLLKSYFVIERNTVKVRPLHDCFGQYLRFARVTSNDRFRNHFLCPFTSRVTLHFETRTARVNRAPVRVDDIYLCNATSTCFCRQRNNVF